MNTQIFLDKCAPFISSEVNSTVTPALLPVSAPEPPRLAVTLSRQTGSGAAVVAEKLAAYLQGRAPTSPEPWRVFDRNLIHKVLEDHHWPARYARFVPEDRTSELADFMEEMLGAHPPSGKLVQQTAETILELAQEGNVILVGRAANLITRGMPHVFHVRLVASLENRVKRFRESQSLPERTAQRLILQEDRGRKRYVRKHFDVDLENPLLYDLILNTDTCTCDEAAQVIGEAVLKRFWERARARLRGHRP